MAQLKEISIAGYKSIADLQRLPIGSLNVLIGANGSGKSNFISVFKLLTEVANQQLAALVNRKGGAEAMLHFGSKVTERVSVDVSFGQNGYRFELVPTVDDRFMFHSETARWIAADGAAGKNPNNLGRGHSESKLREPTTSPHLTDYTKYVLSAMDTWRTYHFHDTGETAKVKKKHKANINVRLLEDASNLAAYLRMLHQKHPVEYRRIIAHISLVAPFFADFVHRDDEDVQLEWLQHGHPDVPLLAHTLSDGTLRFICLATLLLQPVDLLPSVVLIDEPELGLHPYAITILAGMLKQVAANRQLIVATQSVQLINELTPEDIIVVEQVDGASTFQRLSSGNLSEWLAEYSLGELWLKNVIGGRP